MPCPYIIRGTIDSPSFRKKGCRNATGKMNYCTAFISISYPLRVLPLNQEGEFFIPDGRSYKARTMVLSKKNRHRKQHSVNPCRMQAIVRGTSKRSTAIIFLQNCRTQCDPQHPADGRKDWNGERGTDE